MSFMVRAAGPALAALLVACGGGGGGGPSDDVGGALDGLCQTVGGGAAQVTANAGGCSGCSLSNTTNAIDGNYASYASFAVPTTGSSQLRGTAQSGVVFPGAAGKSAGALIRQVREDAAFQLTVRTYLDGVLRDSGVAYTRTGSTDTASGSQATRGADAYYGILTALDFDAVEIEMLRTDVQTPDAVRIYEICTR